jgi:DNA-binding MarR family transcriptional regulator
MVMLMEIPCVCATLRQVSRVVTQAYDTALRPLGLTAMQFNLLMVVRGVGEARVTQLAGWMDLDQTTVTRSMKLVEGAGWVEAVATEDRRVRSFRMTESGNALLGKAEKRWSAVQQELLAGIGEKDWKTAQKMLKKIKARAAEL